MATYRQKTVWWADYLKQSDTLVNLTLLGRHPVRVQPPLRNAAWALEAVLIATGYENPCDYIGSYLPRKIAGTDLWSLHSYGIAIDLDYGGDNPDSPDHPGVDRNPHIHRPIVPGDPGFGVEWQLLEHQVRAIEGIVNDHGDPIWKWLGWSIGDTMHFEADQPPDRCEPAGRNLMEYRGVLNVPDAQWARDVIDWAIDSLDPSLIVVGDNFVDDWDRDAMTDGRFWTLLKRYDDARKATP